VDPAHTARGEDGAQRDAGSQGHRWVLRNAAISMGQTLAVSASCIIARMQMHNAICRMRVAHNSAV